MAAAAVARSRIKVSSAAPLPAALAAAAASLGIEVLVENDGTWLTSAARAGGGRIRLIGGDARALAVATGGRPDIAVYSHEVTEAGRVELLPFLHEQALSITAHRFGTPIHLADQFI